MVQKVSVCDNWCMLWDTCVFRLNIQLTDCHKIGKRTLVEEKCALIIEQN